MQWQRWRCSPRLPCSWLRAGAGRRRPARAVGARRRPTRSQKRRAPVDHAGDGSKDRQPEPRDHGAAAGGRITRVVVRTRGDRVTGRLNAAGTVWHSHWALNVRGATGVPRRGWGRRASGSRGRARSGRSRRAKTFSARHRRGYRQTYGVGMPIILYFSRPIRKGGGGAGAPGRTSKRVVGAWYWDGDCRWPRLPVLPPARLLAAAHAGAVHRRT